MKKRAKHYEEKLAIDGTLEDVLKIVANYTSPKYLEKTNDAIAVSKENMEILEEMKSRVKKLKKLSKTVKGGRIKKK